MPKKQVILGLSVVAALTTAVLIPRAYAEPEGEGPFIGAPAGEPGGEPGASISHTSVMTFGEDATTDGETYESTGDSENAILVAEGVINLANPTIKKTGSSEGDGADFYGTNAAVVTLGGTLNITGGSIATDGVHANAVFAYGNSIANVSNSTITTTKDNSGAVMVAGGGTLTATYVTATTKGNSSAPIRSDRGGGTMTIEGGNYTSNGIGSPAIYSTADISVKGATLESTASEGIVIEGKNSVMLEKSKLVADNNKLNGQSETYKNIFIYQSMSGDAEEGAGVFTSNNSEITTKNGDTFFVTNTNAKINLYNSVFNGTPGAFLRVQAGAWGNPGENGGNVDLSLYAQKVEGNIVLDTLSKLNMNMENDSFFKGTINHDDTAKEVNLIASDNSVVVLTGDSYVTSLVSADEDNSNIYGNGFKLFVKGEEIKTNSATPPTDRKNKTTIDTNSEETVDDFSTIGFIIAAASSFLVLVVGGLLIANCASKCRKEGKTQKKDQKKDQKEATKQEQTKDNTKSGQVEGPNGQ